jgi:AcrR family transcriptional regulator
MPNEQALTTEFPKRFAPPTEILRGVLESAGEVGFSNLSIEFVCAEAGISSNDFRSRFQSLEKCFATAYETEGSRMYEWWHRRQGTEAALEEAAAFMVRFPALSRGVFLEVHAAGQPAQVKRLELLDRLAWSLDGAKESSESHRSEPSTGAQFAIGAIEAAFSRALLARDQAGLRTAIPELARMVGALVG